MCYVWTAPSWQGLRSLGPAVRLTARPPVRLFHLVFEPHDGRALVPIPKRSASPRSDINTAAVDSLKALDPKRPIREVTVSVPLVLFLFSEQPRVAFALNAICHTSRLHLIPRRQGDVQD